MQVRELEHELEAVLFERSGPGIALSPAGQQLFAIAGPLVEAMDRLPEVCAEPPATHIPTSFGSQAAPVRWPSCFPRTSAGSGTSTPVSG